MNQLQQQDKNVNVQPFKIVDEPKAMLNDLSTPLIDR